MMFFTCLRSLCFAKRILYISCIRKKYPCDRPKYLVRSKSTSADICLSPYNIADKSQLGIEVAFAASSTLTP